MMCYGALKSNINQDRRPRSIFLFSATLHIDVTQTQTESATEVLQTQAEFNYKFVHTELVI
jgi:hypothetical protein